MLRFDFYNRVTNSLTMESLLRFNSVVIGLVNKIYADLIVNNY